MVEMKVAEERGTEHNEQEPKAAEHEKFFQKKTTKRCLVLVGGCAVVFAIGMAVFAVYNDSKGQQSKGPSTPTFEVDGLIDTSGTNPHAVETPVSGHTFEEALTVEVGTRMAIKIRTTDGGSKPRLSIIIGGTLQSKQLPGATESETASTSVEDAVYGNESRQLVVFEVSPAIAMLNQNISTSFSCVTNYGALSECEYHNSTEHHLARRRKLSVVGKWLGGTWGLSCGLFAVGVAGAAPPCILATIGFGAYWVYSIVYLYVGEDQNIDAQRRMVDAKFGSDANARTEFWESWDEIETDYRESMNTIIDHGNTNQNNYQDDCRYDPNDPDCY